MTGSKQRGITFFFWFVYLCVDNKYIFREERAINREILQEKINKEITFLGYKLPSMTDLADRESPLTLDYVVQTCEHVCGRLFDRNIKRTDR